MKTLGTQREKTELLERLQRLRPDAVRRWGRMSPHQMVCHVNDSLLVMTGDRPARPITGPIALVCRTIVKWVALYAPLRWPPGIPTRPEIDQLLGGTKPDDFQSDVARLTALIELVSSKRFDGSVHPMFGRLSATAWLRWAYLHTDHHLRQFGA